MQTRLALALIATALAGCDDMEREEYQHTELVQDVQRAMCADQPKVRARALSAVSAKSEGRPLGEASQDIAEIADDVAKNGCPPGAKERPKGEQEAEDFLAERYGVEP